MLLLGLPSFPSILKVTWWISKVPIQVKCFECSIRKFPSILNLFKFHINQTNLVQYDLVCQILKAQSCLVQEHQSPKLPLWKKSVFYKDHLQISLAFPCLPPGSISFQSTLSDALSVWPPATLNANHLGNPWKWEAWHVGARYTMVPGCTLHVPNIYRIHVICDMIHKT